MLLFLLAFLGGALTIVSPCILPVLPFVFARADRPFSRNGLPMLAGMAATFAGVGALAAVGGGWAVEANQYGRFAAIALLALFGLALLFPALSDRMTRPLVALGARLSETAEKNAGDGGGTILSSLLLGVATGLLWAPCAGPILGLILTGAALNGASARTSLLLAAYAGGAATSLALALLVGGRIFAAMKRSLGVGEWIRRGLGAAVLASSVAIALGANSGFLARASLASTTSLEQRLLDRFHAAATSANSAAAPTARTRGSNRSAARRGRSTLARRRGRVVELAAAHDGRAQGQGRAHRFLDLFLHQLPAVDSLCAGLGGEIQGQGPRGHRRAYAGIRLREKSR